MQRFFARQLFDGEQWRHNCLFEADSNGHIFSFESEVDKASIGDKNDGMQIIADPVLPMMPNIHSHAFQRAMAGEAERACPNGNDSFWTWRKLMYDFVNHLSPEDIYTIAHWLYIELLKAGYGWVGEFQYLHHDKDGKPYANRAEISLSLMRAAQDAQIGITMLPALYSYSGFDNTPAEEAQKRFLNNEDDYAAILESCVNEAAKSEMMEAGLCFHSLRATSAAQRHSLNHNFKGLPVHIHIAEQGKEVEDCLAHTGKRPIEYLFESGDVNENWTLIHATHCEEHELDLIARNEAIVGLCPTTEANLGDGVFPLTSFLERGGQFAIGSDSHICTHMAEEIRSLEYGQRLSAKKRSICVTENDPSPGKNLLVACLSGGAKSMNSPMDILGNGARADFFTLDLEHPCFYGAEDRPEALLDRYIFARSGARAAIKDVYMNGEKIISGGTHHNEDKAREAFKAVMKKLYTG